jgi:hypothetical protein
MEAGTEYQRGGEDDDSQRDTENGRAPRRGAPTDSRVEREADAHHRRGRETRGGGPMGQARSARAGPLQPLGDALGVLSMSRC